MPRLGELETAIMHVVWSVGEPLTVREILDELSPERDYAYTTVMTVADNLHTKGWLRREKVGKAYLYEAIASREEYTAYLMSEALRESDDRAGAFLHFIEDMSLADTDALRSALRRLSRRKAQRQAHPGPFQQKKLRR
ncbi:BlaI/MecI/CopY family transcriptional regulator [Flindersiella endophytica]